jgi:hypothetical protein
MSFLAPAALVGVLLLAIPILVHLFKPRQMRHTPFSSLRWLRLSPQRLSRRVRMHQLLLFALRAGFILLLVIALARPSVGTGTGGQATDRYIVLDVSRSMAYRTAGQPTPLARAKKIAADLLRSGREGDRTALLLTGSTTRLVTPPVLNPQAHLGELRSVRAGFTGTDLGSALEVIRPLIIRRRPGTDSELYFLTDNHQGRWKQSAVAAFTRGLKAPVRVRVIDVGVPAPRNAWVADVRLLNPAGSDRRALQVEVGASGGGRQERTVHLTGLKGLPERSRSVTVQPGRPARVRFELPPGANLKGQVAKVRLEPPDGLPSDDTFYLNLDTAAALNVLLVAPDEAAALHLEKALEVLAESPGQALHLVRKAPAGVGVGDVRRADVIFLAGVPELPAAPLRALKARVRAGAGLVVFLGPAVKKGFYNNRLYDRLRPSAGLLPLPLKDVTGPGPGRPDPAPLRRVRWEHPVLAPLRDPVLGDLARAGFRTYYRFAAAPAATDVVLARVGNQPLLVERSVGAGKVVLFNTTANDDWGNLPRRNSFVPLIDRLVGYLSAGGVRRSFEAGEVVLLPLPGWRRGEKVAVRTPGGARRTPVLVHENGRTLLRLDRVGEPGVYRVQRRNTSAPGFAFVVHPGRGDSVLTPTDSGTLARWWDPIPVKVIPSAEAERGRAVGAGSWALWPWLVAAAGLVLVAEMFFVHRLCPRVAAAAVEPVVGHKGGQ